MISLKSDTVPVLDKGHVKLIQHMGDDMSVVNAARVSFDKYSDDMTPGDARLISFLVREGHFSTLRHATVTLAIRAPLMVVRQHWKYVVGSDHTMDGWNENSRRYITEHEEFYIPKADEWRSAPDNLKQGSGENLDTMLGQMLTQQLLDDVDTQMAHYTWALDKGVCAEQARLFLPAYGLYVNYWWTASLQSLTHFLSQRLDHAAQKEIQSYAHAIQLLTEPLFPVTYKHFGF